ETLAGLGLIGRGEKGTLAVQQSTGTSRPSYQAPHPLYLHLLITQKPNRPPWEKVSEEEIRWEAQVATERETGQDVLLAFTSLVKAVAFMQPAILAGLIHDVNQMGKFRRETVEAWGRPVLVNPALDDLQGATSRYVLVCRWITANASGTKQPKKPGHTIEIAPVWGKPRRSSRPARSPPWPPPLAKT
ncbi:MAG: hypothetical protein C4310_09665, partial [Chloroflexota bacterium]